VNTAKIRREKVGVVIAEDPWFSLHEQRDLAKWYDSLIRQKSGPTVAS